MLKDTVYRRCYEGLGRVRRWGRKTRWPWMGRWMAIGGFMADSSGHWGVPPPDKSMPCRSHFQLNQSHGYLAAEMTELERVYLHAKKATGSRR